MSATTSLACERVRAIAAGTAPPEDALEQALRALLEAVGAAAGAICLYDADETLLRLAVESGLSDEGCRQLRTVRAGVGWETPLHGVHDRRPYVIRSAPGNCHVPPLVEPVETIRAIACLPLARRGTPLGSLILVALAPSGLSRTALRELRPALRALVHIIGQARRRAGDGRVALARPVAPPQPGVLESVAAQALRGVEPVLREAFRLLAATLQPFTGPAADAAVGHPALEATLAEAERERRVLLARLEGAATAQVDLAARHAAELGRATARLAETVARADGLQQELAAFRARSATEREEGVRRALDAGRAAEEARAAAILEVETLRAAMANAQAAIMAAEDETRHAHAAAERQEAAARALCDERDRLSRALDASRALEHVLQTEAAQAVRERDTVWAESERLVADACVREAAATARVAQLEETFAQARARAGELAGERDRLVHELDDAAARERRAREELVGEIARNAVERDELLQHALATTRAAEEARATAAAEAEALRAAVAQVEAALLTAENDARRERDETARLEEVARAADAEVERLQAERDAARAAERAVGARLAQLEQDVEQVREERSRVELAADEREAEADQRWAISLHDAEAAVARERERAVQARAAEAQLAHELQEAVARERRTRAGLEAMLAESSADRQETLRRALDRARVAEEARTAAVAEAEAARVALVELRAALVAAEDDARRLAGEAERFEEAGGSLADERDRLRVDLHEALAREQEARTRVAQLVADVDALREQHAHQERASAAREQEIEARWAARLGEAERIATGERTRVAELVGERDGMAGELRDAVGRERLTREELEAVLARSDADRQETLRQALDTTRTAEDARAAAAAEAETTRAALADARAAALAAEGETQRVSAELQRIEAAHETARSQLDRMARELEDARAAEQEARARLAARAAQPAPAPAATPATAARPSSSRPAPAPSPASGRIVVLDTNPMWQSDDAGDQPIIVAPEGAALDRIREIAPGHVVANLAAPGVLDAARALCTSGADVVLRGCLGVAGAARVLPLGLVAVAASPFDPDEILVLVGAIAERSVRVLVAGADPDPCLSLRHALTRAGMSVSIAWDGKQAADLLGMVRPEVVVVDLGLPRQDGYALVADLAGMEPMPCTILVPRGSAESGFAAALRDRLDGPRAVTPAQLLASLRRST